jgi:hypothetical protein
MDISHSNSKTRFEERLNSWRDSKYRRALGSSDRVPQILVDAANKPEVIHRIRNLMILARIADTPEPELLGPGLPDSGCAARHKCNFSF